VEGGTEGGGEGGRDGASNGDSGGVVVGGIDDTSDGGDMNDGNIS
jgi:hypothetical protein